mmetsp:Transcript_15402/g.45059  ORF Transcript_15402/g.45059 Transcript_15402/m.45059 type:complete len:260 (-) Transcript_15402:78-857(-)
MLRAQGVETAVLLQRLHLLIDRAGEGVLSEELLDRALLTLRRPPVVREDVDDQGVVREALALQLVQDLAVLRVRVLQVACVDLHEAQLEGALPLRYLLPPVHGGVDGGQLGRRRYPTHRLLPLEGHVAQLLPPHVEPAPVPVRPAGPDVVGPVRAARRKVEKEGPVRSEGPVGPDELHGLVGHVLGQVVALLGCPRRLDRVGVLVEARVVLRGLARQEAVKVAEAQAGGILVEGPRLHEVVHRGVVPLPEGRGVVAVAL